MPQVRTTTLKRHYVFAKRSLHNKAIVKNTPIAYRLCSEIIKIYYSLGILLFMPAWQASELGYFGLFDIAHIKNLMIILFILFGLGSLLAIPALLIPTTVTAFICYSIFWRQSFWRYVLALIYQIWCSIIWAYLVYFLCAALIHIV